MFVIVLALLFVASNVAIVSGYYNTSYWPDMLGVALVYEHVPVLAASAALSAFQPVNLLIAFHSSRGDYSTYRTSLLVGNWVGPMLLMLVVLPGAIAIPDVLGFNVLTMISLATAAQFAACAFVRDRVWLRGGRLLPEPRIEG